MPVTLGTFARDAARPTALKSVDPVVSRDCRPLKLATVPVPPVVLELSRFSVAAACAQDHSIWLNTFLPEAQKVYVVRCTADL